MASRVKSSPSRSQLLLSFALLVAALGPSCASKPVAPDEVTRGRDPKYLLDQACSAGRMVTSARGSVFMKAKSPDAEGQFPADVSAQAPSKLRLEVQNPIGGTEAIISVEEERYELQVPKKKEAGEKGTGSWAGIPLKWATDLFLGRVPCPRSEEIQSSTLNDKGGLEIQTAASVRGGAEKFVFTFKKESGEPWPETLHWERFGAFAVSVDFRFSDPETKTRSPQKWEAKSARGEVKVRWRDRRISTH